MYVTLVLCCAVQPRLVQVYDSSKGDGSLHISLELSFPHKLVKRAGAPAKAWLVLASAADSRQLQVMRALYQCVPLVLGRDAEL